LSRTRNIFCSRLRMSLSMNLIRRSPIVHIQSTPIAGILAYAVPSASASWLVHRFHGGKPYTLASQYAGPVVLPHANQPPLGLPLHFVVESATGDSVTFHALKASAEQYAGTRKLPPLHPASRL
jgi:hypothetical protein